MPSATSTATRLPAAWVLPGLAKSDSPGEALISLRTAVGSAIGCAGGSTTRTGTAGWSVPRAAAENFPGEGSDL